jgi:UDP-N-acetylmuramoylalanine--D-glutamate ligase
MEDYFLTKLEIFSKQGAEDWSVIQWSAAQQILRQMEKCGGKKINLKSRQITYSAETNQADMHVQDGWIVYNGSHGLPVGKWLDIKELKLLGDHNLENVMAALLATVLSGVSVHQACQSASKFEPSDHRCQLVGVVKGVNYINDSKATNVDATRQALKMVPEGKKTWLIAGGKDKGFDFGGLEDLLSCRVRGAILIGETRERIRKEWEQHVHCMFANSLEEAVYYAARNAVAGEVVLLSPACSSFDMFKSYAHRGELFREYVEKVKKEKEI